MPKAKTAMASNERIVKVEKLTNRNGKKDREVVYPILTVNGVEIPIPSTYITQGQAKERLGWQEETEDNRFGDKYDFVDTRGCKIRCTNNTNNRPFDRKKALEHAQNILTKAWRFNGETMIFGKSGDTLSAQHRLIGFIFACQMWEREDHWKLMWEEEPTIQSLIVQGIDDDPETVRTIDNVNPRTLDDVLYTIGFFPKSKLGERKSAIKNLSHCIKFLWDRTGAKNDPWSPNRTHAESLEFISRHGGPKGRLIKSVEHITIEDSPKDGGYRAITQFIHPGVASGLMWLMA